jgi:hypothetical protein
MSETNRPTTLTSEQVSYLTSGFDELPDDIRWVLELRQRPTLLSDDQRRVLIDRIADRLQERGFDEKYEPTEEGRLLEGILDALRFTTQ